MEGGGRGVSWRANWEGGKVGLTDCSKGSSRQRGRVSRSQRKVVVVCLVVGGMVGGIARWQALPLGRVARTWLSFSHAGHGW